MNKKTPVPEVVAPTVPASLGNAQAVLEHASNQLAKAANAKVAADAEFVKCKTAHQSARLTFEKIVHEVLQATA